MAMGGGVALAGNGGTGTSSGDTQSAGAQTLKPGARGAAVKRLQKKLGLSPDGVYGSATKRAVKKFQKRAGLKADGIAGPATLQRLGVKVRAEETGDDQPADEGSSVQVPAKLQRIAQCESGGDPTAVSADGTYRGKYQFDVQTWESMGGEGDPAKAPEATQDRLAVKLYKARGSAPWGRCANA